MKYSNYLFGMLIMITLSAYSFRAEWGFWGHRKINRMAVFTLPAEMAGFYKKHIEYITEHAVDPDKRRYATRHEAVRHYIDIDHWGTYPYDNVPRDWTAALMQHTQFGIINGKGDTCTYKLRTALAPKFPSDSKALVFRSVGCANRHSITAKEYKKYFVDNILPQYYEDKWQMSCEDWQKLTRKAVDCETVIVEEHFSEYGIVPYNLVHMQARLTKAFERKDVERILRLSAEMGHYVGDAHVPLHTTTNYNGQLTDQVGIHAFWESRLPELFADEDYDFFVGRAEYIEDPQTYYWDVVLASHILVDTVLAIEKELSETFPEDQQFCFEERLNRTIRTQCREYALAYHQRMDGMVERRMRDAVRSIGSAWYTAWIDAGQPDMGDFYVKDIKASEEDEEVNKKYKDGRIIGRKHDAF
ncbi:MAG: zinc dependent phospholipase C family protein [Saprospiraceae bacterium]|nr:zinc dependent phospholipase C family protein [Saprospiraceae bacterium]